MVASFLDVDPIDVDEARRLADGHNRMLYAGAAPAPRVRIAPVMGAGGGGLVLRGEF